MNPIWCGGQLPPQSVGRDLDGKPFAQNGLDTRKCFQHAPKGVFLLCRLDSVEKSVQPGHSLKAIAGFDMLAYKMESPEVGQQPPLLRRHCTSPCGVQQVRNALCVGAIYRASDFQQPVPICGAGNA